MRTWLPRILAIIYILFISIFALDAFDSTHSAAQIAVDLCMHLLPSFLLGAITILAWRQRMAGGIAFLVMGIIFTVWFRTPLNPPAFLFISLPLFLIGGLFLVHIPR